MIDRIINDWDPVGLFPYAPSDEYKTEIHLIEMFVKQNNTNIEILADEIQRIFIKSFGTDVFKWSKDELRDIAQVIMEHK